MPWLDSLGTHPSGSGAAFWANRILLAGTLLFAASVPHSIAAAHISLDICVFAWIARDLSARRLHFRRTPIDLPILAFTLLSILSALFSLEPRLSVRKLLSLLLFGVVYLFVSNLSIRGAKVVGILLIVSSLTAVFFSFGEKIVGRGIVVTSIDSDSPLRDSGLVPGDAIWMLNRKAVRSASDVQRRVSRLAPGQQVEIEATRHGDPLPLQLILSDDLKRRNNPLGLQYGGSTRSFRASGFTRHFLTFADQMAVFASICVGMMLAGVVRKRFPWWWCALAGLYFVALALSGSRAAIVAFLCGFAVTALIAGGARLLVWAIPLILVLGMLAAAALVTWRAPDTLRMIDDSTSRRLEYMKAGLRVIPSHLLLGIGIDSHKLHWKELGFPGDYITHTHSTPIQIAMDRGIPALVCLVWIFAVMLRIAKRSDSGLGLGVFCALVVVGLTSLVNYNFGDSEVLLLVLAWFGLLLVEDSLEDTKTAKN